MTRGRRRRRRSLWPSRGGGGSAPPVRPATPSRYTPATDAPAPVMTQPTRTPTIAPVQAKLTRGERRRRERTQQRRRRLSVVGVLVVVGALIAAFVVFKVASSVTSKKGDAGVRTQTTLLVQIRGADGKAAASALLAHDSRTKRGVILLVPGRVITDIPGRGSAPFANALTLGPAALSQATLTDLIGVTVDGALVLDQAGFARLVNNLGGITAKVDTDVLQRQKNGSAVVLVPAGSAERLDGVAAAAYATYNAGGDIVQLPRFQQVLEGILAKTTSADVFAKAITGLGGSMVTTMPVPRISQLMVGLAVDVQTDNVDIQTLDVKPIDTGGAPAFIIDAAAVKTFVQASLAASIPKGLLTGNNRVLVKNGIGKPLLGTSTRPKLLRAGFVYIDGGNVPGFPFRARPSAVLIFSGTQEARDRGTRVAAALGLPASDVQISTLGQSVADVIVVLGRDYKP